STLKPSTPTAARRRRSKRRWCWRGGFRAGFLALSYRLSAISYEIVDDCISRLMPRFFGSSIQKAGGVSRHGVARYAATVLLATRFPFSLSSHTEQPLARIVGFPGIKQ